MPFTINKDNFMDQNQTLRAIIFRERVYLVCAAIFISSLVTGNLIFQKFFYWTIHVFSFEYTFEISVGILPYPVTFLVTDIVSEIYGERRSNQVVFAGFVANLYMLLIVLIALALPQTVWSPVSNEMFGQVFGLSPAAVFASICAYLIAQLLDVRLFHFWKRLTNGKHLWLRNNASTICSQFVDTFTVILLLCIFGVIEWERFEGLVANGFFFKVIMALLDTPIIYAVVWYLQKKMHLKPGEELPDDQVLA